jgi:hypothetical protein
MIFFIKFVAFSKYFIFKVKVLALVIAYFLTVLFYASTYYYLQELGTIQYFNQTNLKFIDFVYFSIVTISTVGFGDVSVVLGNTIAQYLVIAEIVTGLTIGLFGIAILFSQKNNDQEIFAILKTVRSEMIMNNIYRIKVKKIKSIKDKIWEKMKKDKLKKEGFSGFEYKKASYLLDYNRRKRIKHKK